MLYLSDGGDSKSFRFLKRTTRLESNGKLYDHQNNFRSGRSTADNVLILNMKLGKYTLPVFIDIKNAFEKMIIVILLKKIKDHTCSIL